jgi:nicotinate phosphoribosyltransferase
VSVFDGKRLPADVFKLDVERMRAGWYSDKYFNNIVRILSELARSGYRFGGRSPDLPDRDPSHVDVGNLEVEMQWFHRREPFAVVVGVDKCLAMLRTCTGYVDGRGRFVNTFERLDVRAVHDGTVAPYEGDPRKIFPVLKVRGRYRDFAMLETPTIGTLTRGSRIATNVFEVLRAARGKPVLFFPARFDAHEVQAADGYAYRIAVQLFNTRYRAELLPQVSTDAQGDWWGGAGGGTVAHAAIACFLGDTAEALMTFAQILPADIPRIALVDFHNDCLADTRAVMSRMFARWLELTRAGDHEQARKYVLYGVRPDTSGSMRDVSVPPIGDRRLDCGVNPRLVHLLRATVDTAWQEWTLEAGDVSLAREWCQQVKIAVSGGFTPARIKQFEDLGVPADMYAVGSWLFSNSSENGTSTDFTADVVRVKLDGEWVDLAKVGRQAVDSDALEPVR